MAPGGGALCPSSAAAAMKSLCLVTVGVLAMTLLIASISLLVAHVFQTVVDLQVKEVRARPDSHRDPS